HLSSCHPSSPQTYTLSLHDALPISHEGRGWRAQHRDPALVLFGFGSRGEVCGKQHVRPGGAAKSRHHTVSPDTAGPAGRAKGITDRKSTRLNSSHQIISYAVFCLKK